MILFFLRYLMGYLCVRFEGVYSEKILSMLSQARVTVWHLKYSDGNITGRMFAKDFKKLRKIRRKTGVKIRIVEKRGFPFFWRKYSRRSGFLLGAVIFLVLLKFLSTFIWVINVEGNSKVKTADIVKTLNEIGISENMKISQINSKISAQNLLMKRDDLAWASLNIEGCVLNVNVSEIKKRPRQDDGMPTNLVAGRDGIIKKVDAVSGDVRVKVGENVHKGDILVSGIIESMSSTAFVKSRASVIAQVEESFIKKEFFTKNIKKKTGKEEHNDILEILGVKAPLFLPKKADNVRISYDVGQVTLLGKKIPVIIYRRRLSYFKSIKLKSSEEELRNQLSSKLNDFLQNTEIDGYIPIGTEYYTDDYGVTISHRYLCDINIADESKILLG